MFSQFNVRARSGTEMEEMKKVYPTPYGDIPVFDSQSELQHWAPTGAVKAAEAFKRRFLPHVPAELLCEWIVGSIIATR